MRALAPLALAIVVVACSKPAPAPSRVRVEREGSASFRVSPTAGQLPFCLVFSTSSKGVVRQLTMSPKNASVDCTAGAPIGGVTYTAPPSDGATRVYVVFSDQAIEATPIAQQIHEIAEHGGVVTAMDLRAPGQLAIDSFELAPGGG